MQVKQYDKIRLLDGRIADIVEAFENKEFIADVGEDPKTWETISITIDDICEVIKSE